MNNYEAPAVLGSFEAEQLMGEAFGQYLCSLEIVR